MNYKMLVLDIDDTLLNSERHITPKTFQALIEWQQSGRHLVLASGRPTPSLLDVAKQLHMTQYNAYVISFNGAVITRLSDEQPIFSQTIDIAEQPQIIDYLQTNGLSVLTYTDDHRILIDKPNAFSDVESELTGLETLYNSTMIQQLATPRLKFIGVGDDNIVKQLDSQLNGHFGTATYVTTSKPFFLEFMHRDVSKGDSIKRLCQHLNVSLDEVIACGDGNNDLTMIETAGLGVAMANATPLLKNAADVITRSNDEDGIAEIIAQYLA